MKRFVGILLIAIVGVPWTAFSAARGDACAMPMTSAAPACSYCAPVALTSSQVATLQASCCRFLPTPESVLAQAGSIGVTPKPLQSPNLAGAIPAIAGPSIPASAHQAVLARDASPPPAPPTRTTHLLL